MCVHQLDNEVFDIIDARCNHEFHSEVCFNMNIGGISLCIVFVSGFNQLQIMQGMNNLKSETLVWKSGLLGWSLDDFAP